MPQEETLAAQLRLLLATELSDSAVRIEALQQMSGGASRQTFSFDAVMSDGAVLPLVLRRDRSGSDEVGKEPALLAAAAEAGVPVPKVVASGAERQPLGAAFLIMERIEGETIPRKILRESSFIGARQRMAEQCGVILSSIHSIPPEQVPNLAETDQLDQLRGLFEQFGQPHPAFELAFKWLKGSPPLSTRKAVIHGDFRNGNFIVGPEGIKAVLDWEMAHVGDPMEDLGWLCAKPWRFGSELPVGGFGSYQQLVDSYEKASGFGVQASALHWWEVLATLKWGIICIWQCITHTSGLSRSVELAVLGRRVCEVEWDLLGMIYR